jgi:polysaccharide pyruvyl transferase WcaK-like protein
METGILGFIGSKNIGDYIQTKAVIDLVGSRNIKILDRENLDNYNDNVIKTIINGWFMESPENWPPSEKIKPLFISFHLNPSIQVELLKDRSLKYFKRHEPIGCRDTYTRDILLKKGINAFYSSCITTTIDRNNYLKSKTQSEGIIVIGAFDRLKPTLDYKSSFKLLLSILKYPLKKIDYSLKLFQFNRHLNNQDFKIKRYNQITKKPIKSHNEGLKLAAEMLEKIAESEVMITSRIHAALPALAMGLKVIFIDQGLDHVNHKHRLSGLTNYFTCVNLKDFFMINLDNIPATNKHKGQIKKMKDTINKFLIQ